MLFRWDVHGHWSPQAQFDQCCGLSTVFPSPHVVDFAKDFVQKDGAYLHRFIKLEKLIGEGWELSAFKDGDRMHISIPVDSGFASKSYHFEISPQDFSVLRESRYRRMALEYLLHEMLQPRLVRGYVGATDKECEAMIAIVLHGSATAIERMIGRSRNSGRVRRRLEQAGFPAYKGA